ncbi:hypothetical protein [Massilia sp. SYSU DXS3249]
MAHLLSALFHFLRRNLFLFTAIVLVLASGNWIQGEWRRIQAIVDELPALRAAHGEVAARQAALADETARKIRQLSGAPVRRLDAEILALDREIGRLQREQAQGPRLPDVFAGADAMAARLREAAVRSVELELRRQERAYLLALRAHLVVLGDRQAALAKLEQLRLTSLNAYAALRRVETQRIELGKTAETRVKLFFTDEHRQAQKLDRDITLLRAAAARTLRDFLAQQALIRRLATPVAPAAFQVDAQRLAAAATPLREGLLRAENLAAQNAVWQAYLAVRPVLPAALAVLLAWWLVPAALRSVFYFVLAPQAARRPPIVIREAHRPPLSKLPPGRDGARISAVSQRVLLAPGHEMLIRPEYCQSQPAGLTVTTKLLFDWRHGFTSIAARLWMLKRLRTAREAEIVVSPVADALDEVALLEIGAGEAVVLQPRGLVGVIHRTGQPPAIRSHWRLGTLHAWLTLQLRYLAFEGPATLVVKGCRGVRLESATSGRTISQDATLGFSAHALYGTVRAEPFLPYLMGAQPLFHDSFDGAGAYYLYEEVPRNARPGRRRQNPLEVLVDAGLKAFGI